MKNIIFKVTGFYAMFSLAWLNYSDLIVKDTLDNSIYFSIYKDNKAILFTFVSIFMVYLLLLDESIKRKRKDMEKSKAYQLNRNLLENSTAFIFIKDLSGKYSLVNSQFEKEFSTKRTKLIGKSDFQFFPEDVAEELQVSDKHVINTETSISTENRFIIKDKEYFFSISKFPLFNSDGELFAIGGIASNITESKKYIDKLKIDSKLFNNLKSGIVVTDFNLNIIESNLAFLQMLGYTDDEVAGKKLNEVLVPSLADKKIEIKRSHLEKRDGWHGELFIRLTI